MPPKLVVNALTGSPFDSFLQSHLFMSKKLPRRSPLRHFRRGQHLPAGGVARILVRFGLGTSTGALVGRVWRRVTVYTGRESRYVRCDVRFRSLVELLEEVRDLFDVGRGSVYFRGQRVDKSGGQKGLAIDCVT